MKLTTLYKGSGNNLFVGKSNSNVNYATELFPVSRYNVQGLRLFRTKDLLTKYINDLLYFNSSKEYSTESTGNTLIKSAIPGLILPVLNDTDDHKNGLYYVLNNDSTADPGLGLAKIDLNTYKSNTTGGTINISATSEKYTAITCAVSVTISLSTTSGLEYPVEKIIKIKNNGSSNITLTITNGIAMVNTIPETIAAGSIVEIIVTFWPDGDITYNGGEKINN